MGEAEITTLHLFRHGQVVQSAANLIYGQQDVALSSTGQQQSIRIVQWFARKQSKVDALFTSDLLRCQFLADLLAQQLGNQVHNSTCLREQDFGEWQGRSWSELQVQHPERVADFWENYPDALPPQGESANQLKQRVMKWWKEILISYRGKQLVVVTHAGCIRVLVATLLGMAIEQSLRLVPATASYSHLSISDDGAVLMAFSHTIETPSN